MSSHHELAVIQDYRQTLLDQHTKAFLFILSHSVQIGILSMKAAPNGILYKVAVITKFISGTP